MYMKDMIRSRWLEEFSHVFSDVTGIIWINKKGHSYDDVTVR